MSKPFGTTTCEPSTSTPHPISQPFRFKRKLSHSPSPSRSSSSKQQDESSIDPSHRHHRRHRRRHHHRSNRSHRTHASPPKDSDLPPSPDPHLDPDTAFRESLFDALADDEGAAFWEGVYGQPIHTYSPYRVVNGNTNSNGNDNGDASTAADASSSPHLERMSDDDYAAYVRGKMWERSHAHELEERARRAAQRDRLREEARRAERERREWRGRFAGRGEGCVWGDSGGGSGGGNGNQAHAVAARSEWKVEWERYLRGWDALVAETEAAAAAAETETVANTARKTRDEENGAVDGGTAAARWRGKSFRDRIPWPVAGLSAADVSATTIEAFLRHAPSTASEMPEPMALAAVLKRERVRWHPDKVQQRCGGWASGVESGHRRRDAADAADAAAGDEIADEDIRRGRGGDENESENENDNDNDNDNQEDEIGPKERHRDRERHRHRPNGGTAEAGAAIHARSGKEKTRRKARGHEQHGLDAETMRLVTAVFQIVDRLWTQEKERLGRS